MQRFQTNSLSSAASAAAVVPHDANEITGRRGEYPRALYVGTGGDVVVDMVDGAQITFKNVANGSVLDIQVKRVCATDTSAADIVALF